MKQLLVSFCVGLCLTLFADTTLYVKPDGTGAGTSWADAAGLATAVATAKTAGTPHSLYLAKGIYTPGVLEPVPGTSFFGGFAGVSESETLAGRDLAANRTVLSGGNYYWRYGTGNDNVMREGQQVYLWKDGAFNAPDPTAAEHFWKPNGSVRVINLQNVTATGEKLVLDGLTFSAACVWTWKTPVEVRHCDFWGCYDDFGVVWSQTSMSVTDSMFWGSNGPMISSDGAAQTDSLLVSNVVMRCCSATGNVRGFGIYAPSVYLTVADCTFTNNVTAYANATASFIQGNDYSKFTIRDSVFLDNEVMGGAMSLVRLPNYNASMISNCLFHSNRVVGDRGNNSSDVACLVRAPRQTHIIVNTAFVSNVVDRTEAETKAGVTELRVQLVYTDYYNFLLNDTFVGNVVKAQASNPDVTVHASLFAFLNGLNAGIANLTFKDNVAADGDVYLRYTGGKKASFYNCIFTGGAGYKCVGRLGENTTSANFFNCVVNGAPDEDWVHLTDCRTDVPKFCEGYLVKNGVWSLMLDGASVGRRGGIQVYWDKTGTLAFWNGSGWRRCDDATSATNLSEPYTPVPDVYGDYPVRHVVMGAVQDYKKMGLLLIFR